MTDNKTTPAQCTACHGAGRVMKRTTRARGYELKWGDCDDCAGSGWEREEENDD